MPRIVSLPLPAGNKIISFVDLGEQCGDLIGIILQVGIHGDHHIALDVGEADGQCSALAIVATEANGAEARISGMQTFDHVERTVRRSVVDEEDIPTATSYAVKYGLQTTCEFTEGFFLVEQGYHDAYAAVVNTMVVPSTMLLVLLLVLLLLLVLRTTVLATASRAPTSIRLLR